MRELHDGTRGRKRKIQKKFQDTQVKNNLLMGSKSFPRSLLCMKAWEQRGSTAVKTVTHGQQEPHQISHTAINILVMLECENWSEVGFFFFGGTRESRAWEIPRTETRHVMHGRRQTKAFDVIFLSSLRPSLQGTQVFNTKKTKLVKDWSPGLWTQSEDSWLEELRAHVRAEESRFSVKGVGWMPCV